MESYPTGLEAQRLPKGPSTLHNSLLTISGARHLTSGRVDVKVEHAGTVGNGRSLTPSGQGVFT